ncbi:tripartite tricarboxylate transporter substrate binding protein BugD, partial [Bordetella hinzii]|nr:tripartite tricarboxylate transporter substrate binding protein BugD [Bordetella hinzii]
MKRIPMSRRAALLALGGLLSLSAQAQDKNYPTHPLTLVVPFAAGGPTDVVARSLGASMSKTLGQPIVVENRTGAGGTLGPSFVSRAHPDGYTLLIHHNGMATAPALYKKLP